MNKIDYVSTGIIVTGLVGIASYYIYYSKGNRNIDKKKNVRQDKKDKVTFKNDSVKKEGETNVELRGYKKLSNGKVTTYFNREISEEEKVLLGDMSPKRIDPNSTIDNTPKLVSATNTAISAWNRAGTWEERSCTDWAVNKLSKILGGVKVIGACSSVSVSSIENVVGDASVTNTRGKKKYIYDFNLDVKWKLTLVDTSTYSKGSLAVELTSGSEIEIVFKFPENYSDLSPALRREVDDCVKSTIKGLQPLISASVNKFVEEFKHTF